MTDGKYENESGRVSIEHETGKSEADLDKCFDIRERAFNFAVRVVKLCDFLQKDRHVARSLVDQLLRAGTSVGANLEEAKAGQSRSDFIHKNAISLKEAREANYWLRLILATASLDENARRGIIELKNEALEIAKIVGKIIVSSKR